MWLITRIIMLAALSGLTYRMVVNFHSANFAIWLRALSRNVCGFYYSRFNPGKPYPTNSFACEIPVRGSLSQLYFCVFCLPSKNTKFCNSRKCLAVRYMAKLDNTESALLSQTIDWRERDWQWGTLLVPSVFPRDFNQGLLLMWSLHGHE